jgi:hypothetical protein
MPPPVDDDATIRVKPPAPPGQGAPRILLWGFALLASVAVLALGGGWLWWPTPPSPTAAPPPMAAAPVPAPAPVAETPTSAPAEAVPERPEFAIEPATEQDILNHVPPAGAPDPTVFHFMANQHILVLDFASLREQGLMLNRVAALTEKSGLSHREVLSDSALDAAIRSSGDTIETYYYGHDYSAEALTRFFELADSGHIILSDQEEALRRLIGQEGWFARGAPGGLISIPQAGADARVTRAARATILHHELSHGEYFTNAAYATFVHRFWMQTLTTGERDRIKQHLRSVGYDSSIEEVMENEAQAYLMFTDSPEFFTPEMIGMSKARLGELRGGFYKTMPAGWLRDSLGQTLNEGKTATARP